MDRKVLVMKHIVLDEGKASELILGASWYCLLTNMRRHSSWFFLASYFSGFRRPFVREKESGHSENLSRASIS